MIKTTVTKVRFSTEAKANMFIKLMAKTAKDRISNYGYEEGAVKPYWIEVTSIAWETGDNITETELSRWKACGKLRF